MKVSFERQGKAIMFLKRKIIFIISVLVLNNFNIAFAKDNSITIAGSTTILPISERWAKVFKEKTGISVNVHGGGSTGGINATKIGTADIAASSREMSSQEKESLKSVVIGRDALVVILNKSNPIDNLSVEQLRDIYLGRITNWKQLNGPNKLVQLVNRESGSGTKTLFQELVVHSIGSKNLQMSLKSIVNNSNAEVKETVRLIPGAIGYVSFGFVDDSVNGINVNLVKPTISNIKMNKYKLVRNLYYLVRDDNSQLIKRFLEFVLSKDAQQVVLKEGYLPASSV